MMLVLIEMTPSSPPSALSRDFVEHEVSRIYGITIKFGVEVISLSSALVCLVTLDGELFC
jgi:hypothetical protein